MGGVLIYHKQLSLGFNENIRIECLPEQLIFGNFDIILYTCRAAADIAYRILGCFFLGALAAFFITDCVSLGITAAPLRYRTRIGTLDSLKRTADGRNGKFKAFFRIIFGAW